MSPRAAAPARMDIRRRLSTAVRQKRMYAAALASANARFTEKVKELSILRRIGDSISSSLDERTVCESLVNIIISEMTAENCSLMLMAEGGGHLSLRAAQGQTDSGPRYFPEDGPDVGKRIAIGEGVAGHVAKTGRPMLVQNTAKDQHFKKMKKGGKLISSLLCMPIRAGEGVVGVLNLSHPDIGQFSKENERLLTLIVNQAALAFHNIRLFNRGRRFSEELERTVEGRTRELRNSENKYRTLLKQGSDAIIIVDAKNGAIIECNDTAGKLTGWKSEKWLGRPFQELFPEGEPVAAALARLRRKGTAMPDGEGRLNHRRAGKTTAVAVSARRIALEKGPVLYLTIRDITKQALLDQKIKNYSQELEREVTNRTRELQQTQNELIQAAKLAALGELASGVAHEINNPIAIIMGYAEDLKDRIAGDEALGKKTLVSALDLILESAGRCHDITQEILDFSAPQPGRMAEHRLGDILDMAGAMTRARLKRGDITLKVRGTALDDTITTDKNSVVQVLINLINNGVDASDRGKSIEMEAVRRGDTVEITVTDHGCGIPKENLTKVFDPFFTTKQPGKGTGLGLSVSYRIIQKIGGKLTVQSRPGLTVFGIQLPRDGATKVWKGEKNG